MKFIALTESEHRELMTTIATLRDVIALKDETIASVKATSQRWQASAETSLQALQAIQRSLSHPSPHAAPMALESTIVSPAAANAPTAPSMVCRSPINPPVLEVTE